MNKKRWFIVLGVGVVLLLAVGAYAGRNFIADANVTKVEQNEDLTETIDEMMLEANGTVFAQGEFVDADAIHSGDGQASIYTTDGQPILVFEEDFSVTNGPDLVVYLSKNNVASGEDLGDFVSLGGLKSSSGKQVYSLPENYEEFNSVVIWCRAFGVLFASANLSS